MAAARPDTWMPMYWGDYAKDTGHLGAAQHGAYLLLIKHYWVTGQPLPDDDAQLWRIACADSVGHWRKLKPIVMAFFRLEDGAWHHGRIDAELDKAGAFIDQRAAAGRASAEARKRQRQGNTRSTPVDVSLGSPLQREGQREAKTSQSPSPVVEISSVAHEPRAPSPSDMGNPSSEPDLGNPTSPHWDAEPVIDLEPPTFLKQPPPGRAAPLPEGWLPGEDTQRALTKSRPDLTPERITQRTAEFRAHCADTNKHSHNFDAYWFNFVVKTHVERASHPRQVSAERSPAHDGIRAARARRSVQPGH